MKNVSQLPKELKRHEEAMSGIFSHADLAHLMGVSYGSTLQHRISVLVKNGYLHKAQRGWYYTPEATLENLALRLNPNGYVSLTSALARRGVIGTKPSGVVELVTNQGRPGEIHTLLGEIRVHVHKPELHFGFEQVKGRPLATPEKALIDCCYFHLRGIRLPFQLSSDVNWGLLNRVRVEEILQSYQNPKFCKFVNNLLEDAYGD